MDGRLPAKNARALLFGLAESEARRLAAGAAFMAIAMCAGLVMPQIVRVAIDCVIGGEPAPAWASRMLAIIGALDISVQLAICGALVVASTALRGACDWLYRLVTARASEGMMKRLRDEMFAQILDMPYASLVAMKTGDVIQRCTADVEIVRSFFALHLLEIVQSASLVAIAYTVMFAMDPALAAVSFAFIPIIVVYSLLFMRRAAVRYLAADEAEGELLSIAQENFTGVRVVKAFGRERAESDKFSRQNESFADIWITLGGMLSTYWAMGDLLTGAQMIAICAVGIWQASRGAMTVGEFVVFVNYAAMMIWPVRSLGRSISESGKAATSAARIAELLSFEVERDPDDAIEEAPRGDIEFRGVSFSYGERDALRDVSFVLREGQTLGILGATGSGKSTVAHLLCRLYDLGPGQGSITIGGVDVRRYARGVYRRSVGIVLQEPFLYSRTIRENIASLRPDMSMEEIRAAAAVAQLDSAVESFPMGYETIVGERGVTLSGGQKQRAAIARAIAARPSVIAFDDSLSAVDAETDARIRAALAQKTRGLTVVVATHRASSVLSADAVLVMRDGSVVEFGPPSELIARGGELARVLAMQGGGKGGGA